jgi:NAD(P)H-nitrite reductase large subunit
MKHLIIGNSAAGVNAALTIGSLKPEDEVTIVGEEPYPYYGRVLTSYYIDGRVNDKVIFLVNKEFYESKRIKMIIGTKVSSIDFAEKKALLQNKSLEYDRLLIATGATPQKLGVEGEEKKGVFNLRTIDDAREIRNYASNAKRALLIGGGLVGMKAFEAFHNMGIKCTFVVSSPQLLSQALDSESAEVVAASVSRMGAEVLFNSNVNRIEGDGRAERVLLDDGRRIDTDMVVVGKGVKPNTGLLETSEARINRGIVVDRHMQVFDSVYAAGDVAEAFDLLRNESRVNALWPIACEQGMIAGCNMAGYEREYAGAIQMNALTIGKMNLFSIGLTKGCEAVTQKRPYRKLFFKGDRLVGAVLFGDPPAGILRKAIVKGADIKDCTGGDLFTMGAEKTYRIYN